MFKTLTMTVALLASTACKIERHSPDWASAPRDYVCSKEQFELVKDQTVFCNEQGGKLESACYGFAIMMNCNKREEI